MYKPKNCLNNQFKFYPLELILVPNHNHFRGFTRSRAKVLCDPAECSGIRLHPVGNRMSPLLYIEVVNESSSDKPEIFHLIENRQ